MHELAADLIKAIALSLSKEIADDLIQEGHLKLQIIIKEGKYKPGKCSMYTFLSTVLRNHMIDCMRKMRVRYKSYDIDTCNYHIEFDYTPACDTPLVDLYLTKRFPTIINPYIIPYLRDAVKEGLLKPNVIHTAIDYYGLTKNRAVIAYNSVQIAYRYLMIVDAEVNLARPLRRACNGHEFTLEPEQLLTGAPEPTYTSIIEHVNILQSYGKTTRKPCNRRITSWVRHPSV